MKSFRKKWNLLILVKKIAYRNHLRPISDFIRTDDEDQPELILQLDNGLIFIGSYDPSAGMFFADELLVNANTEKQLDYLKNMLIPGRIYSNIVKFQYF